MINRIILIGNGFDLAHGLKTGYNDFIGNYWSVKRRNLIESDGVEDSDDLCRCVIPNKEYRSVLSRPQLFINSSYRDVNAINSFLMEQSKSSLEAFDNVRIEYLNRFFENVNNVCKANDWVDIEAVYYRMLKEIFRDRNGTYDGPKELNEELDRIKNRLADYLSFVQQDFIKPELAKECIKTAILEPFDIRDVSNADMNVFEQFLKERLDNVKNAWNLMKNYGSCDNHSFKMYEDDIERYMNSLKVRPNPYSNASDYYSIRRHVENLKNIGIKKSIPDYFTLPERILLLSFNYTKTAELYIPQGSGFEVNHIHGELDNENNPIIFGYGDELDDDYKQMSKSGDNEYLRNVKSIRYLETDNYRKLLGFVDSAPFQIYLMGHSCGVSDRTLLNTLFEHRNCISIKPFYHLKKDGSDDYIKLIQNISRNFNDMRLMRDRVVNKTYCRPLVPAEEQ